MKLQKLFWSFSTLSQAVGWTLRWKKMWRGVRSSILKHSALRLLFRVFFFFFFPPQVIHRWKSMWCSGSKTEVKTEDCSWQKFWDKGQWSKHRWWMACYVERQQTTSSIKTLGVMADDERRSESNTGWQAVASRSPTWTPELARLAADHLIGSLVRPEALTWALSS